jgi:hypothetical protein
MNNFQLGGVLAVSALLATTSCKKEHGGPINDSATISVENVLESKPLNCKKNNPLKERLVSVENE